MPKKASGLKYLNTGVRKYLFLNYYVTSEGAVSHKGLYDLQPLIANYQKLVQCL